MKFAFLVCLELRCLKHIDSLYKYLIDYYDADIFICVQDAPDVKNKIKLFNRKVKKIKIIKKKENPIIEYFNNPLLNTFGRGNFHSNGILNFYINLIEMGKFIKDDIINYDYFIFLRTDIHILFEFPPINKFKKIKPSIFSFNPNYCKRWGGWGTHSFIHKNYIYQSLTCFDEILRNNKLIQQYYNEKNFKVPNQETFSNFCYKISNLPTKYIENLNFYFCADINSIEEMKKANTIKKIGYYSLRKKIYYDKERNQFFKYKEQYKEAYNNLKLKKKNYKWKLDENTNIYLKKI